MINNIIWRVIEHRRLLSCFYKLPAQIIKKYELWKDIIHMHGPEKLREFPGFHDEALKGLRSGQRSSRLNLKYRVIYSVELTDTLVKVWEITAHKY